MSVEENQKESKRRELPSLCTHSERWPMSVCMGRVVCALLYFAGGGEKGGQARLHAACARVASKVARGGKM